MAEFVVSGYYEENFETRILDEYSVIEAVKSSQHLRKELSDCGAFDLVSYEKEREESLRLMKIEMAKAREIRERKKLAELKAKYPEEGDK